jgi:hypothetical protein
MAFSNRHWTRITVTLLPLFIALLHASDTMCIPAL